MIIMSSYEKNTATKDMFFFSNVEINKWLPDPFLHKRRVDGTDRARVSLTIRVCYLWYYILQYQKQQYIIQSCGVRVRFCILYAPSAWSRGLPWQLPFTTPFGAINIVRINLQDNSLTSDNVSSLIIFLPLRNRY